MSDTFGSKHIDGFANALCTGGFTGMRHTAHAFRLRFNECIGEKSSGPLFLVPPQTDPYDAHIPQRHSQFYRLTGFVSAKITCEIDDQHNVDAVLDLFLIESLPNR